jgi:hypothetical protein
MDVDDAAQIFLPVFALMACFIAHARAKLPASVWRRNRARAHQSVRDARLRPQSPGYGL